MKVIIASARRDENGKYSGGKPGDQDGVEVSTQNYYVHTKGWYMLRFLSDEYAKKVAKAMWDACMNNNIGYCQAHRSIMAMLKKYGSMKAIGVMVTTQPTTEHAGIMWHTETKPGSVHLHIYREPKAM